MTGSPAEAQHLRDLALLHRVRDRMDREYAQPLDVEALARGAHMSAGHFSREFRRAYGESPYSYDRDTLGFEQLQASDAEVVQEPIELAWAVLSDDRLGRTPRSGAACGSSSA